MAVRVITLGLLIGLSLAASAESLTGKVVKITDGDTLYVLGKGLSSRVGNFVQRGSWLLLLFRLFEPRRDHG